MDLRLMIDGRLVAASPAGIGPDRGHLYVFHEYGNWSLLAVTATPDNDGGTGTASITLECHASLAELASAVQAQSGPTAWQALLEVGGHEIKRLGTEPGRPHAWGNGAHTSERPGRA